MKALMLVLPYNTPDNESNSNLEELYTRAPLTKLVTNGVKKLNNPKYESNYPESGKVEIVSQSLNGRKPTTYRPKLQTNPTKPRKPTTFHPKMTISSEEVIIPYAHIPKTKVKPEKFHSRYSGETSSEESVEHPKITKHVQGMLASIGLYSDEVEISTTSLPTTTTSTTPKVPELTPELKELLESFGLLKESDPLKKYKLEDSKPFMSSMIRDDSFKVGEFKPLPETLRAEDFRMDFNSPQVKSNDYSSFKPLPIPEDSPKAFTNEMADFLKSFGLFDSSRGKKSIAGKKSQKLAEEIPKIDSEFLPFKMASTLDHMGMSKRSDEVVFENLDTLHAERLIGVEKLELTTKKAVAGSFESFETPSPVFIPSNHKSDSKEPRKLEQPKLFLLTNNSYSDEDDYKKLHQLLETIKQLDSLNANLTDDEISKLELNNYNLSDALLAHGPNPLDNIEIDSAKNEVKRQDSKESENPTRISLGLLETNPFGSITTIEEELIKSTKNGPFSTLEYTGTLDTNTDSKSPEIVLPETTSTTTETPTTDTPTTETETTSTTEASRKASIEDLEDSFAGGADPVTEEPLPPPRRNGFYFLADWNSFLEVGEDPDKIIVRFDPKIGDPSRFLPVTVP